MSFVEGEADRAVGAGERLSTSIADSRCIKTAPIKEEKRLFANFKPRFKGVE